MPNVTAISIKSSGFFSRLALAAVNLLESPLGVGLTALLIYSAISLKFERLFITSLFPYHNYLADAFLHGEVWFRQVPERTHDLIFYSGKYSLYQGPFPAILIMPLVWIFGIGVNDVIFTLVFASLNVALVAYLLRVANRIRLISLTDVQRALLTLFFMLGTVQITQASVGRVWNTTLTIGFTCTVLAYIFALSLTGRKAWFFTGLALTGAMLTRNHLVFTGIFPLVYLLVTQKKSWATTAVNLSIAALPLLFGVAFILFYNQVRFGNPLDNGLAYHLMNPILLPDYNAYGIFNIHYVPINLYYQYLFYPLPIRQETYMGGSLFLLSPVFFGLFGAFTKNRVNWQVWLLLVTILITNLPILLLFGTGFAQFGPRYTLDFTVPMLLLTARGIQNWKTPMLFGLTLVSILQYLMGAPLWVF